jgi:TonB family protein
MGLDNKAIESVKHWRFQAATKNGMPVKAEQSVEISFRLPEAGSWGIRRCLYRVKRGKYGTSKGIIEPMLTNYASPSAGSCGADQGHADVNFEIKKDGTTDNVTITLPNGNGTSESISKAVAGWIFQPGTRKGKREIASGAVELECRSADESPAGGSGGTDQIEPVEQVANGSVAAPTLILKFEPEYSEEARVAKLSGSVLLSIEIDRTGHAVNMAVVKGIGMGLDERAVQAVNQWRFLPAMKDGKPVAVWAQVEVNFRLL